MHVINLFPSSMNHQGISEISFEETYSVPPEQTARALFSRLPHGSDYAQRLKYLRPFGSDGCLSPISHFPDGFSLGFAMPHLRRVNEMDHRMI